MIDAEVANGIKFNLNDRGIPSFISGAAWRDYMRRQAKNMKQ